MNKLDKSPDCIVVVIFTKAQHPVINHRYSYKYIGISCRMENVMFTPINKVYLTVPCINCSVSTRKAYDVPILYVYKRKQSINAQVYYIIVIAIIYTRSRYIL